MPLRPFKHLGLFLIVACTTAVPALAQVDQAWMHQFEGTSHESDDFNDMTIDDSGNIHVAGSVYNVGTGNDVSVTKLASDGTVLWSRFWDDPAGTSDYASAIEVDDAGNVYVSGYSYQSGTHFTLLKYDLDGTFQWARMWSHFSGNVTNDMAIDADGNIFVAGHTWGSSGDAAILKYNSDGVLQWSQIYGGDGWQQPRYIETDSAGAVYAGGGTSAGSGDDMLVIKYDTTGNLLWSRQFEYIPGEHDQMNAMAVASDGTVHFTGSSRVLGDNYDIVSGCYDTNGNLLWSAGHGGGDSMEDYGRGVTYDANGHTYVAGEVMRAGWETDTIVLRYDAVGTPVWNHRFTDAALLSDSANSISVNDQDGRVYLTGSTDRLIGGLAAGGGAPTDYPLFAACLNDDGSETWRWVELSGGAESMSGSACRALPGGAVLIAGYLNTAAESNGFFLMRLQSDCNNNGVLDATDIAEGTSLDCNGNGIPDECDIAGSESLDCNANTIPDECEIANNPSLDNDGTGILDACEDQGDLDGDGNVSFGDLIILLSGWGECSGPCTADFDGNGTIDFGDLIWMLANWS